MPPPVVVYNHPGMVFDAHGLPDLPGSSDGFGRRLGTQPGIAWIARKPNECAGSRHCDQFMVIVGQLMGFAGLQTVFKPGPVGAVNVFRITRHVFGCSPCRCTATTGFLSDGQCNTLIESASPQRHFSTVRTTGDANFGQIDAMLIFRKFQTVDQTAHSPSPGTVTTNRLGAYRPFAAINRFFPQLGIHFEIMLLERSHGQANGRHDYRRESLRRVGKSRLSTHCRPDACRQVGARQCPVNALVTKHLTNHHVQNGSQRPAAEPGAAPRLLRDQPAHHEGQIILEPREVGEEVVDGGLPLGAVHERIFLYRVGYLGAPCLNLCRYARF
jgi:hypothetical protein